MKREKGFTLTELILVIVLIGIIGVTASPMLTQTSIFEKRFVLDEFLNMLRYARKAAGATGCEVAILSRDNEIGLYMRANCDKDDFTHVVSSPFLTDSQTGYHLTLPKGFTISPLPMYIDSQGKVFDSKHQWHRELNIQINSQRFKVDGLSGFIYEKA